MTETQLKELIEFRKLLDSKFTNNSNIIKSEEFKELSGINKDMLITETTCIQTLCGLLTMRIGLNFNAVKEAAKEATKEAVTPNQIPEPNAAEEEATPIEEATEQPVSQ